MEARNYSWPPFERGNQAARRHGANASDLGALAGAIAAEVRRVAPWATAEAFAGDVEALAWAEARCRRYRAWFADQDLFDGDGAPRAGLERWERAESAAARARENLGLTPMALSKLLGQLGAIDAPAAQDGLEALKAAGREIREAADQRAIGSGDPGAEEGAEADEGDVDGGVEPEGSAALGA